MEGTLHHETFVDKMRNMPSNLQNVMRKIRNTTEKEINAFLGLKNFSNKNLLSEEDIRQYEQLVIMKKYPYLDIKELEMKYSPTSNKEARQSEKFHSRLNIPSESGICEPAEDTINVEIINRGLSGFAIPTQLVKHNKLKTDLKINNEKSQNSENYGKAPTDRSILAMLKDDINMYIQKKENDIISY